MPPRPGIDIGEEADAAKNVLGEAFAALEVQERLGCVEGDARAASGLDAEHVALPA